MATRHEVSSGGIVYKVTKKGVFVAFIRDSVGKMTFPKGHVEPGESIEQTARREVYEETGLKGLRLVRKLGKITITFEDRYIKKGDTIVKDIHYFLFEAPEHARFRRVSTPGDGESIRGRRWVLLRETQQFSEYDDMEMIVERAVALIARQVRRRNRVNPFNGRSLDALRRKKGSGKNSEDAVDDKKPRRSRARRKSGTAKRRPAKERKK